jgi:ABC-type multidrug transport system ATPase subunit
MTISLSDAGKRFNRDWIFRHLTYRFTAPNHYAITGPNGSGKSTLLQAIGGALALSEGTLHHDPHDTLAPPPKGGSAFHQEVHQNISIAAPYLDLIEEMTLTEFLEFHAVFKPLLPGISVAAIVGILGMQKAASKQIRYYSSGMKQRVKLAQAIFSDVPVLLLDEPCTNLDEAGISLYLQMIKDYCGSRLVLVSSNDRTEYGFCTETLHIMDYKQQALANQDPN